MKINLSRNIHLSDLDWPKEKKLFQTWYLGIEHAILETAKGLFQTFPHRTNVVINKSQSPHLNLILPSLSREGLIAIDVKQSSEVFNIDSKTALFVIWMSDDPLTGEKYETASVVEWAIKNRVPLLHISTLTFGALSESAFYGWIFGATPHMAFGSLGAKLRVERLLGPKSLPEELIASYKFQDALEDRDVILKFEKELIDISQSYFVHMDRVFDRAAIILKNVDAQAVIEHIHSQSNQWVGQLQTSSLNFWNQPKMVQWLKDKGLSDDDIQGLLLVGLGAIKNGVRDSIEESYRHIFSLQS